jgi:hypothetical protein
MLERLDLHQSGHEDQRGIAQSAGYPVGHGNQLDFRWQKRHPHAAHRNRWARRVVGVMLASGKC